MILTWTLTFQVIFQLMGSCSPSNPTALGCMYDPLVPTDTLR